MQTVEKFMVSARMGKRHFEAEYPHPFLVLEETPTALARRAFGFMTEVTPNGVMSGRQSSALRRADSILLARVCKRPGNPFSERISIGRTAKTDITIADSRVSKLHAYIQQRDDGSHALGDVDSRNGTRVNGLTLRGGELVPIALRDLLEIGPFRLRFCAASEVCEKLRSLLSSEGEALGSVRTPS